MSDIATRLARPEILALTPYQSARREHSGGTVWLNANESPWNNADEPQANRYPDCQPSSVREGYASYAGVKPEQVLISRGADEGIELLIRTFCRPGIDKVATFGPSYGMYAISAATNAVECQTLPWADGYQLSANFAEQVKDAKLVFVCNPNNPTGTIIDTDKLLELATQLPDSLLVIDEAYIEFCPNYTVAKALDNHPNLVVLRTLSKAFALAGARCGFTLASAEIIAMLEKVIAPYPVPAPVARLATEALSDAGLNTMRAQVAELNQLRNGLVERLKANPAIHEVLPSQTNFVLFRLDNAKPLQLKLADKGLLIRAYGGAALKDWLRISIGTQEELSEVEQALFSLMTETEQD